MTRPWLRHFSPRPLSFGQAHPLPQAGSSREKSLFWQDRAVVVTDAQFVPAKETD